LPALSINWGAFSEVGMAAAQDNRGKRLSSRGIESLTPAQGHELLGALLGGRAVQIGVLHADFRRWRESYPAGEVPPMLSGLLDARGAEAPRAAATGESRLGEALLRAAADERTGLLEGFIREQLAKVLERSASDIDRLLPLTSFGIDSLTGLELKNRVEAELQVRLAPTFLFKHPTLASFVEFLADEWARSALGPPEGASGRRCESHEALEGDKLTTS
jgi:acyl carrier protein